MAAMENIARKDNWKLESVSREEEAIRRSKAAMATELRKFDAAEKEQRQHDQQGHEHGTQHRRTLLTTAT